MARDIYNRNAEYGGSFPADMATLTFGKLANAKGAVVQQLNLNYEQAVSRLYEIGSPLFYYVHGRTDGTLTLQQVLGPSDIVDQVIREFGDICSPSSLQISATTGCKATRATKTLACGDCVARQLGASMSSDNALLIKSMQLMVGWVAQN